MKLTSSTSVRCSPNELLVGTLSAETLPPDFRLSVLLLTRRPWPARARRSRCRGHCRPRTTISNRWLPTRAGGRAVRPCSNRRRRPRGRPRLAPRLAGGLRRQSIGRPLGLEPHRARGECDGSTMAAMPSSLAARTRRDVTRGIPTPCFESSRLPSRGWLGPSDVRQRGGQDGCPGVRDLELGNLGEKLRTPGAEACHKR